MSTLTVNGSTVKKMTIKDSSGTEQKVKKWYHDGVKVFSSGSTCTYYVDTNDVHSEEIEGGENCLSPKTFTPSKTGYTFVGWRENNTASSEVLSSKLMGEDPVILYAVFKQIFSLSFSNNYSSGGSMSPIYGTQYYNNGNIVNPQVTLPSDGYSRSGLTFLKWVLGAPGTKVTLTSSTSTRAVCKYPDNNSPYFYWDSSHTGSWGAGIMRGGVHIIDGSKYSQIYINKISMDRYSIWVDNNASHSSCKYIRTPAELSSNGMLFHAWCSIYDGYNTRFYNGNDWSNGALHLDISGVTVSLPARNVAFGSDALDDSAENLDATGIKLIGRTVS